MTLVRPAHLMATKKCQVAVGSNPAWTTFQSPDFWRCQRIDRNRRVCARFVIARGPGEGLGRRKSQESGRTYPSAILPGPLIIALDSPEEGTPDYPRERSSSKGDCGCTRTQPGMSTFSADIAAAIRAEAEQQNPSTAARGQRRFSNPLSRVVLGAQFCWSIGGRIVEPGF